MSFITSPGVIVPPLTAGGVAYGTGGQAKVNSAGTAGQFLQSAGAGVPIWASAGVIRIARTSNTALALSNNGNLISITSGTFTQTFAAAATLGSGWFCYIQNSGTGDVTLDPNGAELIDGLTSYIVYPGECRLVQCTGTEFNTVVLSPFSKTFSASGTFIKPPGYSVFSGLLWGGGGSGGRSSNLLFKPGAGGGGACVPFLLTATAIGTSQTVTIGAGGAGIAAGTAGNNGGDTTFGTLATAYGGGGGSGNATFDQTGAGGGGALSAGSSSSLGGQPNNTTGTLADRRTNSGFGGASAVNTNVTPTGSSAYGGGAGASGQQLTPDGGASLYGGGGGGTTDSGLGGTSVFGGAGGIGSTGAGDGGSGVTPSGGGGGTQTGTSGSGGSGKAIIWGQA